MDEKTLQKFSLKRGAIKNIFNFKGENSWNDLTKMSEKQAKRLFDDKHIRRMENAIETFLKRIRENEINQEKDSIFTACNHEDISSLTKKQRM